MAIIFDFFAIIAQLGQQTALIEGSLLPQLGKKLSLPKHPSPPFTLISLSLSALACFVKVKGMKLSLYLRVKNRKKG